jgi:PelA/Pel-15E family pectate lyase
MKKHIIMSAMSAALCAALFAVPAAAATVGTIALAQPLTSARIQALPAAEQKPWLTYLDRSNNFRDADKEALAAERAGLTAIPPPPPEHTHDSSMPLDKDAAWYASAEARHIADNIVSFQTPTGGWGKNVDRSGPVRVRGQDYVAGDVKPGADGKPLEPSWSYVGTIDNDATTTELRFLALVQKQLPGKAGDAYRASFVKGLQYLIYAQYPNGGWPQVYPLQGGYHDAVTYNDNAIADVLDMLAPIGIDQDGAYDFVPGDVRNKILRAVRKGLDCILKSQIVTDGQLTVWGQQHDMLTLLPVAARNFEPGLPSPGETSDILMYLMSFAAPTPEMVKSVHAAAAWMKKTKIDGYSWTSGHLESSAKSKPLWARFYDPATLKPRFGDRDKTIHDELNDLSEERRIGYAWYGTWGDKVLKTYAKWAKAHPAD